MYITPHQYDFAYESIIRSARNLSSLAPSGCPILIVPSMDPDALFATRILTTLLERDCLSYRLSPVSGWKELGRVISGLKWNRGNGDGEDEEEEDAGTNETRILVLINVGASIDLYGYLHLPPDVTCHLIDSHRPYALENIFSSTDADVDVRRGAPATGGKVVVWDDGDIAEDMKEELEAYRALEFEPDSEEEGSDDDGEEGSDAEDERAFRAAQRRQRQRMGSSSSLGSEDEAEDEDDEDEDGEPRRKKRRRKARDGENGIPRLSARDKQKFTSRIKKYFASGTSHGQSVAGMMYALAGTRGLADNDLLWLAILGLTYQFTASLIDRNRYDVYATTYDNEVRRINITQLPLLPIPGDDHLPPVRTRNGAGPAGGDDRNIRAANELRFVLLRHWNLYDSMYHSSYLAGKLKLWRERGRRNFHSMLAKMGYSLLDCQESYSHMKKDLKDALPHKIDFVAEEQGIHDVVFPSFVRTCGYESELSASDCVEAVAALLEVANGIRLEFGAIANGGSAMSVAVSMHEASGQGGSYWDGGRGVKRWTEMGAGGASTTEEDKENRRPGGDVNGTQTMSAAAKKAAREEAWWVQNFWLAWDSLSSTDTSLLRSALPLSMALHRSVIRQGTSLLDKQAIKTLRSFRLAVIREGPDLGVFCHPATLSRLGIWLIDAVRDLITGPVAAGQKKPKSLPFVVASLDEAKDTYWVVGVNGAVDYGDVRKNKFGQAFQAAAELSNARARHDRFEESACEVRKDDLMAFVEKLHLAL